MANRITNSRLYTPRGDAHDRYSRAFGRFQERRRG